MNNQQEILPVQVQKIHIAKQQVKLSDQDYRDILSGFNNREGKPCASSKELTEEQANALLSIFRDKLGWKETRKYKDGKYAQFAGRDTKYASVGQLELMDAAWYNNPNVRVKTDEAMNSFITRITGVNKIEYVLKRDVKRVLKGMESITEGGQKLEVRGQEMEK